MLELHRSTTMDNTSPRTIQSVETACQIIDHLRKFEEVSISELADAFDHSPGTLHTYLITLKQYGLVTQNTDTKTYQLGPQFLTLGEFVRNHSELYEASKNQVEELAEKTGECAHLIIEHNGQLYALYERFGNNAVGVEYHDRKREEPLDHLHCTAAGKAILAHLPKEEVYEICSSSKLTKNTQHTITGPEDLFRELEKIQDQGFALADEEQMQGIRAVGAPVKGTHGLPEGAVALSGPTTRLQGKKFREEIPQLIIQTSNVCEMNLQTMSLGDEL